MRINAPPTAFDDGVKDGLTLTGISLADEEPVLLAHGGRADGVFELVVVDLHASVLQPHAKGGYWPSAYSMAQPKRLWADMEDVKTFTQAAPLQDPLSSVV